MLKLETSRDSHHLRVSGRIEAGNLAELKTQMQSIPSSIALELDEVTLVDAEAVHFLAVAEAAGTKLHNCPLFIREWIRREQAELAKDDCKESAV